MDDGKIIERITVIALLLAILFGIMQTIPVDKKYDFFTVEMSLKVFSESFFQTVLLFFVIYVILEAINLGDGLKGAVPDRALTFFYNLPVLFSFFAIFFILGIGLLISLGSYLPSVFIILFSQIFIIFCLVVFVILFNRFVVNQVFPRKN